MPDARPAADALVNFMTRALHDPVLPEIPEELAGVDGLLELRGKLRTLRDILDSFSRGDFSPEIRLRGVMAGRLKTLQANLLHLCWQIEQVAGGDFTQRVDFLGEFSTSFNSMVEQLDTALTTLRHKEEELTLLTVALQREVREKADAMEALSRSEARFRYMAEHDPLTGVCNRRSFYDLAVMDLEKARKSGQPCTLLMFDIDFFKRFNDTYGHLEGDATLRHVAATIKRQMREQDIFGRYGGEEFVILLPGLDKEAGKVVAERIRAAVESAPVVIKEVGPVLVTISIGGIAIAAEGREERKTDFLEKILGLADEMLYNAKKAGRNRVKFSPSPAA